MACKSMTPEWEAEIIADFNSGMRLIDIATKHHIGKRRVMDIRDRHGLVRPKGCRKERSDFREMTAEWEDEIVCDLIDGMRVTDIIKKHHISYDRLANIQSKHSLFRQRGKQKRNEDELDMAFWEEFAPQWERTRIVVLGLLSGKKKKRESWIKV